MTYYETAAVVNDRYGIVSMNGYIYLRRVTRERFVELAVDSGR